VGIERSVKQKFRILNFSIVNNKKPSNPTTIATPATPPSPEPEWIFEGLSNSDQMETDTEEEHWIGVNSRPSQEETVQQLKATDKGKKKYDQMQEWKPTLTGILRKRHHSPTECKDEAPQQLKFYHPPPSPPTS